MSDYIILCIVDKSELGELMNQRNEPRAMGDGDNLRGWAEGQSKYRIFSSIHDATYHFGKEKLGIPRSGIDGRDGWPEWIADYTTAKNLLPSVRNLVFHEEKYRRYCRLHWPKNSELHGKYWIQPPAFLETLLELQLEVVNWLSSISPHEIGLFYQAKSGKFW